MSNPHVEILDNILEEFGFLTDVFGTKPRMENMLAIFLGITISTSATLSSFASVLGAWKDQSSLNRFLTKAKWKLSDFYSAYFGWIEKMITGAKTVYFIIDDTKSRKTGGHIQKTAIDYDHNEGRNILCHTLVLSLVKFGNLELPFLPLLYDKKKKGEPGFKSKLDLAIDQAKEFLKHAGKNQKVIFLFDSWYCAQKVIDSLPEGVWWVSRLKKNRLVKISGFWYSLKEFQGRVKSWNFRRVKIRDDYAWACSFRIEVKGLGLVTLVAAKPLRHSRIMTFFISNMAVDAEKILGHYAERWGIEVFIRTSKQNLGLDGYQMRKLKGNRRYWSLVLLTYSILSVLQRRWRSTCKTIGDALAKLRKLLQKDSLDFEMCFGRMIEFYVERKFAKL